MNTILAKLVALCAVTLALSSPFSRAIGVAEASPPSEGVSIEGRELRLSGRPFIVKGFIFQAFTEVAEELRKCRGEFEYCARHLEAQDFYFGKGRFASMSGLDLAKQWGANTIRLNLNQAALDPESAVYSSAYQRVVEAAVQAARARGFVVILALFDGRNANAPSLLLRENPKMPLDMATTQRAALTLAERFGRDRDVMIELLNEPWSPGPLEAGWTWWRDGGSPSRGPYAGSTFIGVNNEIAALRRAGAQNVIIVQGLGFSFRGFPGGVEDPLGQVAYSVHPFFLDGRPSHMDWDVNFGEMARAHPVLITAWDTLPNERWCERWGMNRPLEFLSYLQARRLGLVVYALDVPFTLVRDFRRLPIQPTVYPQQCARWGGPGELLRRYFRGEPLPVPNDP